GEARICHRGCVILAPREGRGPVLPTPDEQCGHVYARKLFFRVWFTVIAQVPLDRVAIVRSKSLFKSGAYHLVRHQRLIVKLVEKTLPYSRQAECSRRDSYAVVPLRPLRLLMLPRSAIRR